MDTIMNSIHLRRGFLALLLGLSLTTARADDWPQWLGPQRDGVWRETGILKEFPADGPKIRWRAPLGAGYTGPAVVGERVYVMDRQLKNSASNPTDPFQRGTIPGNERVLCLDEANGNIVWTNEYNCPYTVSYPAGPRATPLVSNGKVYTLGTEGNLLCLDAATGKKIWAHELKKDYNLETPVWGFSAAPLLDGQKLICLVGGDGSTVVAFDKDTGKELWKALSAKEPGYCPPMIFEAGGKRQLIIWHPQSLNSLDPDTGKLYWSQPYTARSGLTVPTPRKSGDRLFITSFYNGPMMLQLDSEKPEAKVLWRGKGTGERNTDGIHSIISTPFFEGDYIYGVCSYGQLRCLKAATGERVWETFKATTGDKEVRWANAFLIKNGDRFFLPNEKGDLIIAKLTPRGYDEISRTHLLDPTNRDPGRLVVWSHPAFANRSVYARNDKEIVCASLAEKP
jgi:outer membrane protein assembly factor BamB